MGVGAWGRPDRNGLTGSGDPTVAAKVACGVSTLSGMMSAHPKFGEVRRVTGNIAQEDLEDGPLEGAKLRDVLLFAFAHPLLGAE